MKIEKIAVFGAGKVGSQVAFHAAFHGYSVVVFDINEQAVTRAKERMRDLAEIYRALPGVPEARTLKALENLSYSITLSEAIAEADLMIEAIPGDLGIKTGFYRQLSGVAPDKTIFAAACSALPNSEVVQASGRPDRFIAIHFNGDLWKNKATEITMLSATNVRVLYYAIAFAEAIGLSVSPVQNAG